MGLKKKEKEEGHILKAGGCKWLEGVKQGSRCGASGGNRGPSAFAYTTGIQKSQRKESSSREVERRNAKLHRQTAHAGEYETGRNVILKTYSNRNL